MPAMGGGRGGGLMVPRGGMGRRSSCYPGGPGGGIPPSVHKAGRRASSRSEAGIGLFPGLLGGGKNQVIMYIIEKVHKSVPLFLNLMENGSLFRGFQSKV